MKKLNLGCGEDIKEDYVNLDIVKLKGVDIVHSLEDLPLPFKDNKFDEILCYDVLEHVNYVPLMAEIYRILKPGGIFRIRVPHFSSVYNFIDPTHKNLFSFQTMGFFTKTSNWNGFYFKYKFSEVINSKLDFDKCGWLWFNKIIEPIVNYCDKTKKVYEGTFLRNLFPCSNIYINLKK